MKFNKTMPGLAGFGICLQVHQNHNSPKILVKCPFWGKNTKLSGKFYKTLNPFYFSTIFQTLDIF